MSKLLMSVSVVALALVSAEAQAAPKVEKIRAQKTTDVEGKGIQVAEAKDMVAKAGSEGKGPGLEISGGTSFTAYTFKASQRGTDKGRGHHFASEDSRINFEVAGKAADDDGLDGLEYSFLIGMTGNTEAGKTSVEENRIKLKHRYGTLLAGGHRGVTDFMAVGAFTFYNGTGGTGGNYKNVISVSTGAVVKDDLIAAKDQTKATYVSPRIGGFQAGYSFTPDGNHSGEAKLATAAVTSGAFVKPSGQNIHEFGVNYKRDFISGFGLQLSGTASKGRAKSTRAIVAEGHNDIFSYALGFVMQYAGFSFGGEFLDNGKSLQWKGLSGADAGKVYNVGVGYAQGRHGVSLGYLHSKRKLGTMKTGAGTNFGKATADVTALSYDYKLAKGLKLYAEGVAFNYKNSKVADLKGWSEKHDATSSVVKSNNGHALMLGTAISF